MTTPEIITYALAGLGALVSAASVASALVPPQSTLGLWLAWFASMPIRHVPRKPKGETVAKVTAALLVLLLSGCSILKSPTFWDTAQEACKIALTASPEVQAEAEVRKLTGNEWASVLCELSDVIEQYVVDKDPKKATERALFFTRAKGLTNSGQK